MKYFLYCLQHYADFNGRASRSEFWYFQLFNVLTFIGIYLIIVAIKIVTGIDLGFLIFAYPMALFIPNFAVTARRLHDTNRSGWWQLLTYVTTLTTSVLMLIFIYPLFINGMNEHAFSICMEQKGLLVLLCISIMFYLAAGTLLLVWYCFDSQPGANQYGSNPKEMDY